MDAARTEPGNEAVVATYDRLATAYDRLISPLGAETRELAIDWLGITPGDHILEVGCGPGHAAVELAHRTGPGGSVVGLEASAGMLARARRRVAGSRWPERIGLVRGDARELPLGSGTVEVAFVEDTLELFDASERPTVLGELRRVLAPDGRLAVVTMERAGAERSAFVRIYDWVFDHVPGYARVGCRPIYARQALERAGFSIERVARRRRAHVWPVELLVARPG